MGPTGNLHGRGSLNRSISSAGEMNDNKNSFPVLHNGLAFYPLYFVHRSTVVTKFKTYPYDMARLLYRKFWYFGDIFYLILHESP